MKIRYTVFENKSEPLAHRRVFISRLARMALIAAFATFLCLLLGIWGYHYVAHLAWIDALHNASMILSGMGPVANIDNVGGKLFSSFYALFSGVAFITNISIFLSPVIHRFLHKIHLERKEEQ
jgi:hypothetical protein